MTVFLQPGDRIVVQSPSLVCNNPQAWEQVMRNEIVQVYAQLQVDVVHVIFVSPGQTFAIISVMRDRPRIPRSAEKLKLFNYDPPWYDPDLPVTDTREPLRARWDELNQPHPGYADHPRVP